MKLAEKYRNKGLAGIIVSKDSPTSSSGFRGDFLFLHTIYGNQFVNYNDYYYRC